RLPSVEHPAFAVVLRGGLQACRVAPDRRLSEPEARDDLAFAEAGEPRALLLLAAPLQNRELDERDLDAERRAHRRIRATDLLGDDRVADVVDAHAAVLLRDGSAEESDRRHLPQNVGREFLGAIALARARRDLAVGEVAREFADRFLLGGEVEVHARRG